MQSLNILDLAQASIDSIVLSHQIYMFAIWSVLVELPRLLIRYGKVTANNYLNLHSISMTLLACITIYYAVVMIILFSNSGAQERASSTQLMVHYICAFVMIGVLVLQMLTGVIVRSMMLSDTYKRCWIVTKLIHNISGYLVIAMGRLTISFGLLALNNNDLTKPWWYVLGAIYLLLIIIEIIYRAELPIFLRKLLPHKVSKKTPEDHYYFALAKMIDQGVPTSRILHEFPDARYAIVDNCMYCLDDLDHPGGWFIIKEIIGKEINYLLHGSHKVLSSPHLHQHSKYVWNYLQQRFVAQINFQRTIRLDEDQKKTQWVVQEVQQYSRTLSVFKFSSKGAQFKNSWNSISSLGKYFIVEPIEQGLELMRRPYSMLMCMTDDNIRLRSILRDIYRNRQTMDHVDMVEGPAYSETLPLAIKYCEGGKFTTYLNNFSHKTFNISGPYGRGLNLSENTQGTFVMIAGGTGINPFLDLLDFMLQKVIYRIVRHVFGADVENINPYHYNYELLDEVKIKMVASFASKDEFYGSSILTDLYFLNDAHRLDNFDLILRFSNGDEEPGIKTTTRAFDSDFLREVIDSSQPDRIYVCGPDPLVNCVKEGLEYLHFDEDKIFYL